MNHSLAFELDTIPEPGTRCFNFSSPTGEKHGFVIRFEGEVRAYINRCPHTGVTLNWSDEQFYDLDYRFIQCSMHGALFNPLDGHCVWGPCVGQQLEMLRIELVDNKVIIYS